MLARAGQLVGLLLLLLAMLVLAFAYSRWTDRRVTVTPQPAEKIVAIDGDSFRIGVQEFRLRGIDAPEYRQNCEDGNGAPWPCGKAARASLEAMLLQPGLTCEAEVQDKYRRSLAACSTGQTADIAAAQVLAGMAVTHEFNGMRDYGSEEDSARAAKSGIWQGAFMTPSEWRAGRGDTTK